MTKKQWEKPEVRNIKAGAAEFGKNNGSDASPGVNDAS